MPNYDRAGTLRFDFKGMNTVLPPDAMPGSKYPLVVNGRAYLKGALTPRLPQSASLIPTPLPGSIHSLRRMDDTTPAPIVPVPNGPNGVGTGADVANGTGNPWANPGNITANDGSFASVTVTTGGVNNTDFLEGTNCGFAVGGGVVITGILVEVKGFQTSANAQLVLQLIKAGVIVGSSRITVLPGSNNFVSVGGSGDLWGTTWLPADTNNIGFGVSMAAFTPFSGGTTTTFSVDFVRITVFGYTPSGANAGFVLVEGQADKVFVNSTQVQSGMSGNRLALVPFRPNTSVAPWMYVGDSAKLIKIRSDNTTYKQGIKEPQTSPGLSLSGAGTITGNVKYAYKYRSSATGATSNPSPTADSFTIAAAANAILVSCTASTDPQVDLIDVYRFGDVLNYTYVTTIENASPSFIDNLSAVAIANNPLMAFDDYEPFPSIDIPRSGVVALDYIGPPVVGTAHLTQTSGDLFNIRWLGGTIITISPVGGGAVQPTELILWARPFGTTSLWAQIQPVGTTVPAGNYNYTITLPILAAQPLPAFWGPTDNAAYMFACGDPLRPGTLYFTKGNNPDSAPQTNSIEITSPAEPLIGGAIVGGLSLVLSGERGWLIYPNFAQSTATIVGVQGSPFTTVPSIGDRGLFCKEGICTDGSGNVYYIAKDSIRKSPGGVSSQSITDNDLYNLFPHEGNQQQLYVIGGITIFPPDYSQPNGMALRFSQGYVYYDYVGLDNQSHTLTYDVENDAWSADSYAAVATIHADNPGAFISPGPNVPLGPLVGCVDGTVRQLSSIGNEPNVSMTVLTPSYDAGDQRATKHYGDLYLETTTPAGVTGNFALSLYTDRYSTIQPGAISPATIPATAGVRVGSVVDILSGAGIYARDIGMLITVPVNSVGSVLHLWQPSTILYPETTAERFTDWYDGGSNAAKFFQGVIIEADTANVPKLFTAQLGDNLATVTLREVGAGIAFNGRSKKAFSIASPPIAHSIRITPQDTVPWRVWNVEWVWVPIPELALEWHTEMVSHGFKGWQHIGELNVTHISTADITLTFVTDTGLSVPVVIPNSAGAQLKTYVTIPAFKFKLVGYNLTAAAPFRLWKEDMEVKVKEWGSSGPYQILRPFGGESAVQAEV